MKKFAALSLLLLILVSCYKDQTYTSITHNLHLQNKSAFVILFAKNGDWTLYEPKGYLKGTSAYLYSTTIANVKDIGSKSDLELGSFLTGGTFFYVHADDTITISSKTFSFKKQRTKDNLAFESSLTYDYFLEIENEDLE